MKDVPVRLYSLDFVCSRSLQLLSPYFGVHTGRRFHRNYTNKASRLHKTCIPPVVSTCPLLLCISLIIGSRRPVLRFPTAAQLKAPSSSLFASGIRIVIRCICIAFSPPLLIHLVPRFWRTSGDWRLFVYSFSFCRYRRGLAWLGLVLERRIRRSQTYFMTMFMTRCFISGRLGSGWTGWSVGRLDWFWRSLGVRG
jgi:hypothetical protein